MLRKRNVLTASQVVLFVVAFSFFLFLLGVGVIVWFSSGWVFLNHLSLTDYKILSISRSF